jgi:hypothetical protein
MPAPAFLPALLASLPLQPLFAYGMTKGEALLLLILWLAFFLIAGLIFVTAIVKHPLRFVVVVCVTVGGLCLLVYSYMYWDDCRRLRLARVGWALDIAADPESLVAEGESMLRDQDLQLLRNTTRLKTLKICYSLNGGEQLQYLAGLDKLQNLSLEHNDCVDDAALRYLEGMAQLKELNLGHSKNVTGAGLEHLRTLTRLQKLDLFGTAVTDIGLDHVAALTELRELNLGETKITDAGLKPLQALTQLRKLNLCYTGVTDSGIEHLVALSDLCALDLGSTKITDAGVKCLTRLKKLQELSLISDHVTYDEAQKLQEALPNCKISK